MQSVFVVSYDQIPDLAQRPHSLSQLGEPVVVETESPQLCE